MSRSPYGDEFQCLIDDEEEKEKIDSFLKKDRKTVVVQGLGFVGSAMAAALAGARNKDGVSVFNVIGVDLPDEKNLWKIMRVNSGKPPILSSDKNIETAYENGYKNKNLIATFQQLCLYKSRCGSC